MINVICVCSTIFTVVICVLNYVAANAKANNVYCIRHHILGEEISIQIMMEIYHD